MTFSLPRSTFRLGRRNFIVTCQQRNILNLTLNEDMSPMQLPKSNCNTRNRLRSFVTVSASEHTICNLNRTHKKPSNCTTTCTTTCDASYVRCLCNNKGVKPKPTFPAFCYSGVFSCST